MFFQRLKTSPKASSFSRCLCPAVRAVQIAHGENLMRNTKIKKVDPKIQLARWPFIFAMALLYLQTVTAAVRDDSAWSPQ